LLATDWTAEEKTRIKDTIESEGMIVLPAEFSDVTGKKFHGIFHAVRYNRNGDRLIAIRILRVNGGVFPSPKPAAVETPSTQVPAVASAFPSAETGLDYKFIRVNDAFCKLLGYTPGELTGMVFTAVIHPDERESERKNLSSVLRGDLGIVR